MVNSVRLTIGAIAATFVASLVVALWPTHQPFDGWYDEADPAKADWRLIVDYSVAGLKDRQQYVAHYCRREQPRFQESSWTLGEKTSVWVEEFQGGMNDLYLAGYACGPTGGCSEHTIIQPESTPEGVRLSMDIKRVGGDRPFQASATTDIPFRTPVSGRCGNLNYTAYWERVPGGN
jgi:hypothetical protein